jgi:hypothetical protein
MKTHFWFLLIGFLWSPILLAQGTPPPPPAGAPPGFPLGGLEWLLVAALGLGYIKLKPGKKK